MIATITITTALSFVAIALALIAIFKAMSNVAERQNINKRFHEYEEVIDPTAFHEPDNVLEIFSVCDYYQLSADTPSFNVLNVEAKYDHEEDLNRYNNMSAVTTTVVLRSSDGNSTKDIYDSMPDTIAAIVKDQGTIKKFGYVYGFRHFYDQENDRIVMNTMEANYPSIITSTK